MGKKLIGIAVIILMLFGVVGLTACAPEEEKVELKQGFYNTEDGIGSIRLYGDNLFSFSIIYISNLSTGNYSVNNDKLVLKYSTDSELHFEIGDDQVTFIGAMEEGLFVEEGPVSVGKEFKFVGSTTQELRQGVYSTDDGLSSITLYGENEYIFNRHIATSYRPTGNYSVTNGKLLLHVADDEPFIFNIEKEELRFANETEPLVPSGTLFRLTNQLP
ncbi:MAG: hypothetical protein FWH03_07585 [Firmicutes bacterium]|nr:hypothetical protein [Bacillota bacterium]